MTTSVFPNLLWISKLRFCIFQVTKCIRNLTLFMWPHSKVSHNLSFRIFEKCKCYEAKRKVQTKLYPFFAEELLATASVSKFTFEFPNLGFAFSKSRRNLMKKAYRCHMTVNLRVFNVSVMKWRGRYRQSCSIYSSLINLSFLCLPYQHFNCLF